MEASGVEGLWGMFTIYIDDSGSSPDQRFVVAAGMIFPAKRLDAFEREWHNFLMKERIPELHASECAAHNPKSPYAGWENSHIRSVMLRAQQIIFKYSLQSFSIGIKKSDYDELVPKEMWLSVSESHYVWAASSILGLSFDWASKKQVSMEYVFDTASKDEKRDITEAIDYSEDLYPDHFVGHYSFRVRKEVPGLQAVDLFAWTCFQAAMRTRFQVPMNPIADELWTAFRLHREQQWSEIQSLSREGLEDWVRKTAGSPEDLRLREYKQKRLAERQPQVRKKKPTQRVS